MGKKEENNALLMDYTRQVLDLKKEKKAFGDIMSEKIKMLEAQIKDVALDVAE